jgi:hypothetical protein
VATSGPESRSGCEILEFRNALSWCCRQLARAALLSDNRATRRLHRINQLESVNWTWGLSLIALTIAIHAAGVVMMVLVGFRIRVRLETRKLGLRHVLPIVIGVVGAVGLMLAVLHGIEAAIWAAAYVWLGALDSPKDAILYSVDSMTTRGASGLMLQQHWRMMGALEAADGMLLFGISTAYIFAVMQVCWPMLSPELFVTRRHPR